MYSGSGVGSAEVGLVQLYPVGTGNPRLPLLLVSQLTFVNTGAGEVFLQAGPNNSGIPVQAGATIQIGGNGGIVFDLSQIYIYQGPGNTWSFFAI